MKRDFFPLIVLTIFIGVAWSCQKAPFIVLNSGRSFTYSRNGGSQIITFSTNRNWSVTSSDSWCKASPASGTAADGDITVTVIVEKNNTFDERNCSLTFKAEDLVETITISQESGLGIIVTPTTFELTDVAQTIEIEVQKNVQYTVSIDDSCKDWLKYVETRALTSEKAIFEVSANTSYDNREGLIHFIQEDGTISDVHIFQKQQDALFISGVLENNTLSYKKQLIDIKVSTNIQYQVSIDADWITQVSTKGLQESAVVLSIEENPSFDKRLGNVIIKSENSMFARHIQITQRGKPVDLSFAGTSNCYIVPLKDSTFCFNAAVAGNDVAQNYYRINGGVRAKIVWEASTSYSSYYLLDSVDYEPENNRIVFTTKQAEGNALIALLDNSENILWSWHIWLTNYDPSVDFITFSNGVVLQDRHLGASSDEGIGLYYQWGRKDPFAPNKYIRNYPNDITGSVAYSILHPDSFNSNSDLTNWDWNLDHTARWSTNKTLHDPCPPGWKVMDGNPFCIPSFPAGYTAEFKDRCLILSEPLCTPQTKFRTTGLLHVAGHIQGQESVYLWTNYGTYSMFYVAREMWGGQSSSGSGAGIGTELIGRAYGDNVRCQRE